MSLDQAGAAGLAAAYAYCETQARAGARDRWLGALFAPPPRRRHLHALIAFELEMARLRPSVRDPRAGEIRLAWWREALTGERGGEALANPVAAAMLDTLAQACPPPHLIINAIAGRQFDFYDDPFPAVVDLEAYLGETRSGLIQIAALALSEGRDLGAAQASGLAGVALGLIDWLTSLSGPRPPLLAPSDLLGARHAAPQDFRERRMTPELAAVLRELMALAQRRLGEAERERAGLSPALAPAYAGLATAPLWLASAERHVAQSFVTPVEVAAWRRQWALWRWSRRA
ncbi:MAG TPA: squalene/phytoene synthase family protein [Roseiarcus sp.]|nr:squalene/phytoene synthase family protein [Roseiarcus sp.]